jgi:HlyD family secretion protein
MVITGCERSGPDVFQGYIEGEYVYVASPLGGELTRLYVRRGERVTNNQPLFELDRERELAALNATRANVAEAAAYLDNSRKGLRESEIEALQADLKRLESEYQRALRDQERREQADQNRPGIISQEELDRSRAHVLSTAASLARARAELATGRLGAREDEIRMAEDALKGREAELEQSQWSLDQKRQFAGADAVVHDTLFREGEWVAAGRPVVSLLPPSHVKVRFFVPQNRLSDIRVGHAVNVQWDGADRDYGAEVRFISTRAEYTPPVIYSRESRAKLVFLVEAFFSPEDASSLKVGQPVDVQILPRTP